ncbi:beta-glucosidase 24-like [Thrips palmi]|uniref:Beta-glucosidase 24-like n=1 Tax=Thrips palmi TaxID=161013 RepID=A0A6P8ZQD9_THRPL|nr:beta-glucosidase 24-like [Thrips palmi]
MTSAVQCRKGVNVLDHYYRSHNTAKNLTGDVAADSYHRYKEDIGIAADLGYNVFRFSISWTRLLPNGRTSNVNAKGVQHYHDLLAELKAKKIEPLITMCHFDYPQVFEDEFGGWLGDEMPDVFAEYADFVFNEFGSEETPTTTRQERDRVDDEIKNLVPSNAMDCQVKHNMRLTMMDVKACNAITDTDSTQRCYVCKATQSQFNNIEDMKNREIDESTLQ